MISGKVLNCDIMKSRRITGTLLALMAGAFLAASCTNYGEDIEDINNRLDALTTSDVASMKAQLASMSSLIDGIQDNVAFESMSSMDLSDTNKFRLAG